MMVDPESYYRNKLRGCTPEEIRKEIASLKIKIGRLIAFVESPEYRERKLIIEPSEEVRIFCSLKYLDRAKRSLEEAGSIYIPSAEEKRIENFNKKLEKLVRLEFEAGGFHEGNTTVVYSLNGEYFDREEKHSNDFYGKNIQRKNNAKKRPEFIEGLSSLNIRRWIKNNYNDTDVLDGWGWELRLYYSDQKEPVEITGHMLKPYNFEEFEELIDYREY